MTYFSDKERFHNEKTSLYVSVEAWNGIATIVNALVKNNLLAKDFPKQCPDGNGICGVDEESFHVATFSVIPGTKEFIPQCGEIQYLPADKFELLFESEEENEERKIRFTYDVLDFVEFVFKHIYDVQNGAYHDFFKHFELLILSTNNERRKFVSEVNEIFGRSHIAYKLSDEGKIQRLVDEVLLPPMCLNGKEPTFVDLLHEALVRFKNAKHSERRIGLEKLWDAFERLKTIEKPDDKKQSLDMLLTNVTKGHKAFRDMLEQECHCLTKIGNTFQIRHFEMNKEQLVSEVHLDYLFYRMYTLISLLITAL